jgi:NADH:ubiquinone oxidoreductase subunit 6 (subunit J)
LRYVAWFLGAAAFVMLVPLFAYYDLGRTPRDPLQPAGPAGSLTQLAKTLFIDNLLPFEVTSILILVAIIGAVVLAKRQT